MHRDPTAATTLRFTAKLSDVTHFDDEDLAAAHGPAGDSKGSHKVDRPRIEAAVREILLAIGEDPDRGGLKDTPKRVAKAYEDWFSGYALDPDEYLARKFEEVGGYEEMIVLSDIDYESHCENNMETIIGKVHIG